MSPLVATQRYLEHLVAAWQAQFSDAPITEQQVVLTVPASFDAAARELTREAALAAGLPASFVLLEEPQAAVYSWLAERGDDWRNDLSAGDRLLVCDVGGGTTDLTLIDVAEADGELRWNDWPLAITCWWVATTWTWRWPIKWPHCLPQRA